ncbi:MAG: cobalamin-binding protein [Deltaproteobacteria bacterium]|nr:cobalamin-binding protein [Deltaproteobacteria bacterium]
MDILKRLEEAVVRGNMDEVKDLTQSALDNNLAPLTILDQGMIKGLEVVGQKFECQQIFIPEMLLSAMAMKEGLSLLKPRLENSDTPNLGKVVIGTVEGDVHDIGKNIVSMMLTGAGFQVVDLGFDVPAHKFLDAVKQEKADILALSCLFTPTRLAMKDVLQALLEANMRDKVKVLIGGAPIDQKFCDLIGADGYAPDAPGGVQKARAWLGK